MVEIFRLDPTRWPDRGRIGYCRAGEAQRAYIFLQLGTMDRGVDDAYWQAFFAPWLNHDPNEEIFVDHASGVMQDFVDAADIDWAPQGLDTEAEARLFGLRRHFGANGSLIYASDARLDHVLDVAPARGTVTVMREVAEQSLDFGRVSDAKSLGELVGQIRISQGRLTEDIADDAVISARNITPELLECLERGDPISTHELIHVLEAFDLDLAIIPKRGSLILQDDDPWAEFRGTARS